MESKAQQNKIVYFKTIVIRRHQNNHAFDKSVVLISKSREKEKMEYLFVINTPKILIALIACYQSTSMHFNATLSEFSQI